MDAIINQKKGLRFQKDVQQFIVAFDGIIKRTDNSLFKWPIGSSIYDANPFFEIIKTIFDKSNSNDQEYTFSCVQLEEEPDTKICDISISCSFSEIIIIIYDYTSKYKELLQTVQLKNEYTIKNDQLELKNDYLLKKQEYKNDFLAKINHKIRTPLTGILGFTEVLENTKLNFEQEELIKLLKRESKHLDALVTNMLDISKIEAGQIDVKSDIFDFHQLISDLEKKYNHLAKKKNIDFKVHLDTNIQNKLIGDQIKVQQILLNLFNNAFKYTKKGSISLAVTRNYQRSNKLSINFKITDSGSGIREKNLGYIFDRYTRFNADKKINGSGLGLAIVKNLVDLIGGDIKVSSKINSGSIFSLNLPFSFNPITSKTKTKTKKPPKKYKLPKLGRKFRVLVVEDKEVNQYLVMKMLISQGDFFIDMASNGEEAIKYIERKEYDVVIMDIMMSPINGYKATYKIRNNYGDDCISKVPIIGFTAKNIEGEREKCLKSGMNDFITKPFKKEDLINKISKQISMKYE